jgi:hypothetical protein
MNPFSVTTLPFFILTIKLSGLAQVSAEKNTLDIG